MIFIWSKFNKTPESLARAGGFGRARAGYIIQRSDLIINWGYRGAFTDNDNILNRPDKLSRIADKRTCRQILKSNNIPVPEFSETSFPVVGRPLNHRGGRKFFLCNNEFDVNRAKRREAQYFCKFYNKDEEYRVHIFCGKCILVSKKEGGEGNTPNWNHKSGFKFRHLRRSEWLNDELLMNIQMASKRVIEILGLDFGAVDIMVNRNLEPQYMICEVNCAPALSDLAIDKYVKAIKRIRG